MRNAILGNDLETIFWSLLFLSILMFQIKKWCFVIVSMDSIRKIADYSFWLKPVTFLVSHSTGFSSGCHTIIWPSPSTVHTYDPLATFQVCVSIPILWRLPLLKKVYKKMIGGMCLLVTWSFQTLHYICENLNSSCGDSRTGTVLSVIRLGPLTGTALILEGGVQFVIN